MPDNNIRKVYDALSAKYTNMAQPYEEFESMMTDEQNRRKVYDALSKKYTNMAQTWEEFNTMLTPAQQALEPAAEPVQPETNGLKGKFNAMRQSFASRRQNAEQELAQRQADSARIEEQMPDTLSAAGKLKYGYEAMQEKPEIAAERQRKEELKAEKQAAKDTAKQFIEAEKEKIDEAKKEYKEQRATKRRKFLEAGLESLRGYDPMSMTMPAGGTEQQIEGIVRTQQLFDEYAKAKVASDKLDKALDYVKAVDKNRGVIGGTLETAKDLATWDFGYSGALNNTTFEELAARKAAGEELSASEEEILQAVAISQYLTDNVSEGVKTGYKVGENLSPMIGFMVSMALNPAAGLGKAFMKWAPRKFGKTFMGKALKRATGEAVEAAVGAATSGAGRTLENVTERHLGETTYNVTPEGYIEYAGQENQKDWGEAWAKGFGSQWIEFFTEGAGGPMQSIFKNITGGAAKKIGTESLRKIDDILNGTPKSVLQGWLRDFKKAAKWDGFVFETLEEELGMLMEPFITGDSTLGENFAVFSSDPEIAARARENQIVTIWTTAMASGAFAAAEVGSSRIGKKFNDDLNKADQEGAQVFTPEQWENIKDTMEEAETPEDLARQVKDMVYADGLSNDQRKAIMSYFAELVKVQHFNEGQLMRREEMTRMANNLMAAYDAGYRMATVGQPQQLRGVREDFIKSEEAIVAYDQTNLNINLLEIAHNLEQADMAEREAVLSGLSEEEAELVETYLGCAERFKGLYDGFNDASEAQKMTFLEAIKPAIVEQTDADGNQTQTITTATTADGRQVFVTGNDGKIAYILDEQTGKEAYPLDQLSNIQSETVEQVMEEYQASVQDQEWATREHNLQHNEKTQPITVGMVIGDGENTVIVTDMGEGWATIQQATTDKDGNTIPKPDGWSRDVTKDYLLAVQDDIYDQRDAMDGNPVPSSLGAGQQGGQRADAAARARTRIDEWANRIGVQVSIAESADQVQDQTARDYIAAGGNPTGWYNPNTKQVEMYLPGLLQAQDVEKEVDATYLHEVIAHAGLRALLDPDVEGQTNNHENFNMLMERVWEDLMDDDQRSFFLKYNEDAGLTFGSEVAARRAAADEFCARMAEHMNANPTEEEQTLWQKFVQMVKDILDQIGLGQSLTYDEMEQILRASLANYEQNARSERQEAPAAEQQSATPNLDQITPITDSDGNITDYEWASVPVDVAIAGMREAGLDDDIIQDTAKDMIKQLEEKAKSLAKPQKGSMLTPFQRQQNKIEMTKLGAQVKFWQDMLAALSSEPSQAEAVSPVPVAQQEEKPQATQQAPKRKKVVKRNIPKSEIQQMRKEIDRVIDEMDFETQVKFAVSRYGHSIVWGNDKNGTKGLGSHIIATRGGASNNDMLRYIAWIKNRENGGLYPEEIAEYIMADLPEALTEGYDTRDGLRVVLDTITSSTSPSDVVRQVYQALITSQEEAAREEEERQQDAYARERGFASYEDLVTFEELWTSGEDIVEIPAEQLEDYYNTLYGTDTNEGVGTESPGVVQQPAGQNEDNSGGDTLVQAEGPDSGSIGNGTAGTEAGADAVLPGAASAETGVTAEDEISEEDKAKARKFLEGTGKKWRDKPLTTLAEVRWFLNWINYNGSTSKILTDEQGNKFVKYQANGSVTPNIYLGKTTPREIFKQFLLYGNTMEVNIPNDIQAEFEIERLESKRVSDDAWAEDREQVKSILTEAGIPFVDVIDSERGSRIIFTDRKNDNGNYLDYMDVSDADQAKRDIEFIRVKAEKYNPEGPTLFRTAPNGKKSNLTDEQWETVRTSKFKRLFGEWNFPSKTAKNVIVKDGAPTTRQEAIAILKQLKEKQKLINSDGGEYFVNKDKGTHIYVSNSDAKHSMSFRNIDQIKAIGQVNELIENAIFLKTEEPKPGEPADTKRVYIYYCPVFSSGKQYSARMVVKEYEKGSFILDELHLYNIQLRKIEEGSDTQRNLPEGIPPHLPEPLSEYKGIDLLHSTQQNDKNFATKVLDENGEPLVVYRGADFDPLAQEPGKGVIKPQAYFTADKEYASRYGNTTRAYFLNIRHPFDVRNEEDMAVLREFIPEDHKISVGSTGALDWAELSSFDLDELIEKHPEYDGMIFDEGGEFVGDGDVSYRGVSYMPFKGGSQVKSATDNNGEFSKDNPDVRFRQANDRASLMGAHNITAENLKQILKRGGLANPSMAVVNTDNHIHTNYGEISLIPYASRLDASQYPGVVTYSGDAYTPNYPHVVHELTDKGEKKIWDMAERIGKGNKEVERFVQNNLSNHAEDNGTHLTFEYAFEHGFNPEVVYEQPLYSKEEYDRLHAIVGDKSANELTREEEDRVLDILIADKQKSVDESIEKLKSGKKGKFTDKLLATLEHRVEDYRKDITYEDGEIAFSTLDNYIYRVNEAEYLRNHPRIDSYKTRDRALQQISEAGLNDDYWNWVEDLFTDEEWPEKIFVGYTPSGTRLYVSNTLENASRLMNKEPENNAEDWHGYNATRSLMLKKMRTLSDIRKYKDLLTAEEDYHDQAEKMSEEWTDLVGELSDMQKISDNPFSNMDYAEARIQEAMLKSNPIAHLNREYGYHIDKDGDFGKRLLDAIFAMESAPAKYFETKFKRPVYLNEFKTAIVPDNLDKELRDKLSQAGINVVDYTHNDLEDRINKTRQATEGDTDVRFRVANENQAIFVSNAAKAVGSIKQEKATPQQWLAMIQKQGGIKAGEDKWLRLSQWLQEQTAKTLTKQEVLDYISENKIQIEEQRYGDIDSEEALRADIQQSVGDGRSLEELQDEYDEILANADDAISELDGEIETFEGQMYEKYGERWDEKMDNTESYRYNDMTTRRSEWLNEPSDAAFREMVDRYGDDFQLGYFINGQGYLDYNIDPFEADENASAIEGTRPLNSTRLGYTTEGLDNKREIALTVPTIEPWNESDRVHFGDAGEGRVVAWIRFGDAKRAKPTEDEIAKRIIQMATAEEWEKVDGSNFVAKKDLYYQPGTTNHYGASYIVDNGDGTFMVGGPMASRMPDNKYSSLEEAVNAFNKRVAEIRQSDEKILVIDEIQSKRHQEGRERGYKSSFSQEELDQARRESLLYGNELYEKYILNRKDRLGKDFLDYATDEEREHFRELVDKVSEITRVQYHGIPDAPFEKNWMELAMKRMLRLAAEEGYDKVAWTTGEQQAERYNIGRYIDYIEREEDDDEGNKLFNLQFKGSTLAQEITTDKEGNVLSLHGGELEGKNLTDIVGKELAIRMLNLDIDDAIEDEDMLVGAEGMKTFYDQMMVNFMNKYGKQWGVKVEDTFLPLLQEGSWQNAGHIDHGGLIMHSVNITDQMKKDVMEGQTMFRIGDNEKTHEMNGKQKQPGEEVRVAAEAITADIMPFESSPVTKEEIAAARDTNLVKQWKRSKNGDLARMFGSIPDFVRDFAEATLGIDNKYGLDGRVYYHAAEEMDYIMDYAREHGLDAAIVGKYNFKDGETIGRLIEEAKPLYTEQELTEIKKVLPEGTIEALNGALQAFADEKRIREEMERIRALDDGKTMENALTLYAVVYNRLKENYEGDGRYFHTLGRNIMANPRRAINKDIFKEIIQRIAAGPVKVNLALEDMSDAVDDIRFRLSNNNRKVVTSWLNKRTDLTEAEKAAVLNDIDEIKDAKMQLATGWWFAKGSIRLPEDMPKVEQAVAVSTIAKVDPLKYSSPMELINAHANIQVKDKPINPDEVSTLHKYRELPDGIVVYGVDDSEESRQNMRRIIDTHFGKESSPWCLLQGDGEGNLTERSREYWDYYNSYPKQVAFKNGKLLAFSANRGPVRWWDRMDSSHMGIPVEGKIPNDKLGRSAVMEYDPMDGEATVVGDMWKGNPENGPFEVYYDTGELKRRTTRKNHEDIGLVEAWYKNGQKQAEFVNNDFGMSEGPFTTWHKNGQVYTTGIFDRGRNIGVHESYYENGQLEIRSVYPDKWTGHSHPIEPRKRFYESGQIRSIEPFDENGIKNGTEIGWFEDGQKEVEVEYVNNEPKRAIRWFQNGDVGSKKYWDEDGHKTGVWEIYRWDWEKKKSVLQERTTYKNGAKNGVYEEYYPNGQIKLRSNYKDAIADGLAENWDEDGKMFLRFVITGGKTIGHEYYDYDNGEVAQMYSMRNSAGEFRNYVRRLPMEGYTPLTEEEMLTYPDWVKEEMEANPTMFRTVTDPLLLDMLESGAKQKGYRTVAVNENGEFGSPMAGRLGKKGSKSRGTSPFRLGAWEEAEENPDIATEDGKVNLIKPGKKGSVGGVDYNPYIHIRPTSVNKQFTQAWARPELVYIETEYPERELTSGYKADKAKLSVGRHPWNGGELILSRWDKPTRIVPWEEVADQWEQEFKESGVTFDIVAPQMLDILSDRGVEILPPKKSAGKPAMEAYKRWKNGRGPEGGDDIRMRIAYHGSKADFDKFDLSHFGESTGTFHPYGVYTTDNAKRALSYAKGNLYEVEIPNNLFDFNGFFSSEDKARILDVIGNNHPEKINKARRAIGKRGSDGGYVIADYLTLADMEELGYAGYVKPMGIAAYHEGDPLEMVIFNPDNVKILKHYKGTMEELKSQLSNDDTRFRITPEQDAEYRKAYEEGDAEKAAQMVKDAFKAKYPNTVATNRKGEPLMVYHGTYQEGFNVFAQPGENLQGLIWTSRTKKYAESYTGNGNEANETEEVNVPQKDGIYRLFVNIEKPLNIGYIEDFVGSETWDSLAKKLKLSPEELFKELEVKNKQEYDYYVNAGRGYSHFVKYKYPIFEFTRKSTFVELLKKNGYDGVVAREGGYGNVDEVTTYGAVNSNQVKSAEPFTFDDEDKLIPLSKRFDENNDIRFRKADTQQESLFTPEEMSGKAPVVTSRRAEDIIPPLRKLEPGEVCLVQRKMTEDKNFNFTVGNKIESLDDIAYIFRELEDKSVENCFVVFFGGECKEAVVLHLSMGGLSSASVDLRNILPVLQAVKPSNVCLVHNHPSGQLIKSRQDDALLMAFGQLINTFAPDVIVEPGVIIDTKSGKYGVFGTGWYEKSQQRDMPEKVEGEHGLKVYNFDKSVFEPGFKPEGLKIIRNSRDVYDIAAFISGQRLGERGKINILCLNQASGVIGNFFSDLTGLEKLEDGKRLADEAVRYAGSCGATAVIVYGSGIPDRRKGYSPEADAAMRAYLQRMRIADIEPLEAVGIDEDYNSYYSYADHGVMEPENNYGDTRFRVYEDRQEGESARDFVKRLRQDYRQEFNEVGPMVILGEQKLMKPELKVKLSLPYDANINKVYGVYESLFDENGKIENALGWNLSTLGIDKTIIFARDKLTKARTAMTTMIHENIHGIVSKWTPDDRAKAAAAILKWADDKYGQALEDNDIRKLYSKLQSKPETDEDNELIAHIVGFDIEKGVDRERVAEYASKFEGTAALFDEILNKIHKTDGNIRRDGGDNQSSGSGRGETAGAGEINSSENTLFRKGAPKREPKEYQRIENLLGIAAARYEKAMDNMNTRLTEVVQDSMRSVKEMQDAISEADGKPIRDFENAYWAAIQYSSRNKAMQEAYHKKFYRPLLDEIAALVRGAKDPEAAMDELNAYLLAKHGLERNEVFARRDAKKDHEEWMNQHPNSSVTEDDFYNKYRRRDYSGLTALTMQKKVQDAEQMAQVIVDNYEKTHDTVNLWKRINAATKETLRTSMQGGVLSEEKYKELATMFEHYVPLRGFDQTTSDDIYGYYGTVNSPYNTAIKKAYGRRSLADSPIATIGNIADSEIMRVNRNRIYMAALSLAENHHNGLLSVSELMFAFNPVTKEWEVSLPQLGAEDTPEEVAEKMQQHRAWFAQQLMTDPANYRFSSEMAHVPYKVINKNALGEHQMIATRGGKQYVLTVNGNPRAAQALNGKTNPDSSPALQRLTGINRFLASVFTQYNPSFVLANLTRDGIYTNSMVWAKESPKYAATYNKNWGKALANMASLLKKYKNDTLDDSVPMERYFKEFIDNGGETGYTQLRSVKDYKKIMSRELKDVTSLTPAAAGRKVMEVLGDAVENMNRWAEGVSRFAAYMTSREQGRSVTRSVEDAKEISVNFNKKGSGNASLTDKDKEDKFLSAVATMSQLGRELYVFFNAGVQGVTNAAGVVKNNPAKGTALMLGLFLGGAAIAMMNGGDGDDDDEKDYYNLPEYVRRNNICIKAGKHWITIPMPIELRAFYGLGELAYSVLSGNEYYDPDELGYEVASQISQVLPIDFLEGGQGAAALIPSFAKPLLENKFNEDWTGAPIYNDSPFNENDPEWRKAFRSTSPVLVTASRKLNELSGGNVGRKGTIDINPARIEHLFEGYLGGVGSTLNQAYKTVKMVGDEDLREIRNVPVVNRFVKDADDRAAVRAENRRYNKVSEFVDEITNEDRRLRQMISERVITGYDYDDEAIKDAEQRLEELRSSKEWAFVQQWKAMDKARSAAKEGRDEEAFNDITRQMNEIYKKFRRDK